MLVLKLILLILIITLAQQGLFFSLNASEYLMPKISIAGRKVKNLFDEKSRYEQVRQYVEAGLVDLAIPELKNAVKLYPDDAEVHAYLGWAYSQKELISEASEAFQKALRINPGLQKTPFNYPMAKNIHVAVKEFTASFEEVIHRIDEYAGAHAVLGSCYVQEGRLGDALDEYKKALKLEPDYGQEDVIGHGKETVSAIDQAIREYEEVLKSKPDYVDAHIKLACAHAEKRMLDLSIADMKRAISIEPGRMEAHIYLGCFYAKKWMLDDALRELNEAKRIGGGILERLLAEGERHIHDCVFGKAVSVVKDALAMDPKNRKARWLLAMAYSKNGEWDNAVGVCKEIIRLYPDDIDAYTLPGWMYAQGDLLKEAEDLAEQAIRRNPENAGIGALTAFIYASQNQIREAIAICNEINHRTLATKGIVENYGWVKGKVPSIEQKFREVMDVLEMKPDYAEGCRCLGWLYSKNGDPEKAIAAFQKAIALTPDSYSAHLHLGNVYVQKGEMKNALSEYNEALEVLSKKAQEDMTQGLACFNNGDTGQAIDYFNNALRINPEYTEAYFLLADAYEKKGLYNVGTALRLQGERIK